MQLDNSLITKQGLSESEAVNRLKEYGENVIQEKKENFSLKFLSYFWGPIPWMIEIAAVLAAVVGDWQDVGLILMMLVINAVVGFGEEFKAGNAIEALKKELAPTARVIRDGEWRTLDARFLVPGDVIELQMGKIIPADIQLVEGTPLTVDESGLTGESLPVTKSSGDRAYSSTIVKTGEMKALVMATGANTYFAKTTKLVAQAQPVSHFQQAILRIGNFLIVSTGILIVIVLVVALMRGDSLVDTILFCLVLTVAAIPVALPTVLSVTMAVGAWRLAGMKAIVSKLVSIEEMAGMNILCADKTGTLTKNQLALGETILLQGKDSEQVILVACLASSREGEDPIDQAIFKGLADSKVLEQFSVVEFDPFDPIKKYSMAKVLSNKGHWTVLKGAPQVVLGMCHPDDALSLTVKTHVDQLAQRGYRALGVGLKLTEDSDFKFLGILPLLDPPRDDSKETLTSAKQMGLTIKMITGDHLAIAKEIAGQVGLGKHIETANTSFENVEAIETNDGFAQVLPEHKYRIVKTLQSRGHIVGMTGDGVNDAPALKQADMGIAVSGATDAARASADLVLTLPGLSVIINALEEARKIFERMNSYATFRIAETIRVLLFMTLSIVFFNFYPVTPVMIVLLAILNDFPIMTIAYDNVPFAKHPVRWNMQRLLTLSTVLGISGVISSFIFFWLVRYYFKLPEEIVQTLVFLKLLVAGHMTIYLTRNTGYFWQKPYPNWVLILTAETTQVIGTLLAVYGWFIYPIGWTNALLVWGYAFIWFIINNFIKIGTYQYLKKHPVHSLNEEYLYESN